MIYFICVTFFVFFFIRTTSSNCEHALISIWNQRHFCAKRTFVKSVNTHFRFHSIWLINMKWDPTSLMHQSKSWRCNSIFVCNVISLECFLSSCRKVHKDSSHTSLLNCNPIKMGKSIFSLTLSLGTNMVYAVKCAEHIMCVPMSLWSRVPKSYIRQIHPFFVFVYITDECCMRASSWIMRIFDFSIEIAHKPIFSSFCFSRPNSYRMNVTYMADSRAFCASSTQCTSCVAWHRKLCVCSAQKTKSFI